MNDETKLADTIQLFPPSSKTVIQFHLDEFQPSQFTEINNITIPVKNGRRWYGWLTSEKNIYKNASINYFNDSAEKSILDDEGNACGIIATPSIEITFDNDYIHVLHDLPKRFIYGYLISKLISSEATIQNMILQNICLLLIWGDAK